MGERRGAEPVSLGLQQCSLFAADAGDEHGLSHGFVAVLFSSPVTAWCVCGLNEKARWAPG